MRSVREVSEEAQKCSYCLDDRCEQQVRKVYTDGNLQVLNVCRKALSLIGVRFHFFF